MVAQSQDMDGHGANARGQSAAPTDVVSDGEPEGVPAADPVAKSPRWRAILRRYRLPIASALASIVVVAAAIPTVIALSPKPQSAVSVRLPGPVAFHELPPVVSDIRPGEQPHFASIIMVVELGQDALHHLVEREAEVGDALRTLVRDYQYQDLVGEGGAERFRADSVVVINRVLAPERVDRVLFKEFLLD